MKEKKKVTREGTLGERNREGNGRRGMSMVSWKIVTQPIMLGGLGVRTSRSQSTSLLGKLV